MTCGAAQPCPESSGFVHAVSHDPADHPIVKPNYLAAEADQRINTAGLRLVRAFSKRRTAPYFERETLPGAEVHTDDELLDFARRRTTGYHLVGTSRGWPGNQPRTVVDDESADPRCGKSAGHHRLIDAHPAVGEYIRVDDVLPKRALTLFGDVARKRLPAREARSADCGRQIQGRRASANSGPSITAHLPRLPSRVPVDAYTSIIKPAVVSSLSSKCMNISLSIWVI